MSNETDKTPMCWASLFKYIGLTLAFFYVITLKHIQSLELVRILHSECLFTVKCLQVISKGIGRK